MSFKEQFTFAYDQCANAPDTGLTLDAVALKQALAKLVSRVDAKGALQEFLQARGRHLPAYETESL